MIHLADLTAKKDTLIATAKRCIDLRLQTNAGGNMSVRLDTVEAILINPPALGLTNAPATICKWCIWTVQSKTALSNRPKTLAFISISTTSATIFVPWCTVTALGPQATPVQG